VKSAAKNISSRTGQPITVTGGPGGGPYSGQFVLNVRCDGVVKVSFKAGFAVHGLARRTRRGLISLKGIGHATGCFADDPRPSPLPCNR
jgi:hypothetical protein